ncbi:MAG: NADH-quinone oxidoreductase subunit H, partial [bacterium]
MLQIILIILQSILIISISPLVIGYIRKIKARMQSRVGSPIYQPYVELYKLVRKDSVVPKNTSWVFLTVPYLLVAIVVTISFFIPAITIVSTTTNSYMDGILDIMGIIYLLAFFTFLIAIAAFDAGSSFGGLGAAREYMFSVIVEPIMFMAFLAPVIISGSAQISQIINYNATNFSLETFAVLMICLIGFFIALLAENARFPFDNPSTHLELTMVH